MGILKEQHGAALVGVMMALLVLTLLGTSAFVNSATELKISSNYSQSLEALYITEAGLQELLAAYRRKPSSFLQKHNGAEMNFPVAESDGLSPKGAAYWIKELRYDPLENPGYAEVIIFGRDRTKSSLARLRATISCSASNDSGLLPAVFTVGIVTGGQLQLGGPLNMVGTFHANQGLSFLSPLSGAPLSGTQTTFSQSLDPLRPDYRSAMAIPVISDQFLETWRTLARLEGNQILFGHQNLVLSGEQKGAIIFVDGEVTLTAADLSGLTLIATGSITLNGSTVINAQGSLDTVFIAGGNITLNQCSDIVGVFWANGSLIKLSAGMLKGTVVCQGSIYQKEGFQFERFAHISSSFKFPTITGYTFHIRGWNQI